jgi:hypothetical protein
MISLLIYQKKIKKKSKKKKPKKKKRIVPSIRVGYGVKKVSAFISF